MPCAKVLLAELGIGIVSHVVQMGPVRRQVDGPADARRPRQRRRLRRCAASTPRPRRPWSPRSRRRPRSGDSLGGVVEVIGYGVPVGLGSHVHWDRRLDGLLAQALMSIQAVKGVEIGDGFDVAGRRGSEAHDAIGWDATAGSLPAGDQLERGHRGRHVQRRAGRRPGRP